MKHTTGEWMTIGTSVVIRKNNQIWQVARCNRSPIFGTKLPLAEAEANARLVAAAPELLSVVLEFLFARIHTDRARKLKTKNRAYAVVAQIKGTK